MLEKYSFYDLRDALVRSEVDLQFFHSLPIHNFDGGVSHAHVVVCVIEQLIRHGLLHAREPVTRAIFESLLHLRPNLYREINRVATCHFDIALAPIDPETDETTLVRVRPEMLRGHARGDLVEDLEVLTIRRSNLPEDSQESENLRLKIHSLARELHATGGVTRGQLVAETILEEVIASGSFGTVWRSRSANRGRARATKVFHLDKLSQGLMLARFRRSIQTIRLLTNDTRCPPWIVRIHDVSSDCLAFSMDYARSGTLESMRKHRWDLKAVLAKFRKICEACQFAHEKGIIHRDIKPANILLNDDLDPILIDFDIADATTSRVDYLGASTQGWLGTPVFGAPEQLIDARSADRQSDVFSLGRLLHFMLLGGTSPGMLTEHEPNLEELSDRPATLVEIVRNATCYDPRRRYASVRAIIKDLDRYETGLSAIRVRALRAYRWLRDNRTAVAVAVLALTAALALWRHSDSLARQRLIEAARHAIAACEGERREAERQAILAEMRATRARIEEYAGHADVAETRTADAVLHQREAVLEQAMSSLADPATGILVGARYGEQDGELRWRARLPGLPSPPPASSCRDPAVDAGLDCAITVEYPMVSPAQDSPRKGQASTSIQRPAPPGAPDRPAREKLPLVDRLPAPVMKEIEDTCATKTWPMITFVLAVQVRDGVAVPLRHVPEDPHPAIDCAIEVFKRNAFDVSGITEARIHLREETLENPQAPPRFTQKYREMRRWIRDSERNEREAAQPAIQTDGDKRAELHGAAHDSALRAGLAARAIAEGVLEHRRGLPDWALHYGTIAKRAVQMLETADRNKNLQFESLRRPRDYHPECRLDLRDAWDIADRASKVLPPSDRLLPFFVARQRGYRTYANIDRLCQPAVER